MHQEVSPEMGRRLRALGYHVEDVTDLSEIESALARISNLPGVSADPETRKTIGSIVKGLFGYEESSDSEGSAPTAGRRGSVGGEGVLRQYRKGTETLPGI